MLVVERSLCVLQEVDLVLDRLTPCCVLESRGWGGQGARGISSCRARMADADYQAELGSFENALPELRQVPKMEWRHAGASDGVSALAKEMVKRLQSPCAESDRPPQASGRDR